jgi:hypothetical protein
VAEFREVKAEAKKTTDKTEREPLRTLLAHWEKDSGLAPVRNPDALANLVRADRASWTVFWEEVSTLKKELGAP